MSDVGSSVGMHGALPTVARVGAAAARIQGLIYGAGAATMLYLIVMAYGEDFTAPYRVLALLAGTFSFLMLRRFDLLAAWRMGRPGSVGTQVVYAWATIVGLLLFVAYVAKYSSYFSRIIMTAWVVMTPAALALLNLLARGFTRRFVPHAIAQRSAVIVYANESAQVLARSLQESELYRLDGFFDDRGDGRLGTSARMAPRLGAVSDLTEYVRSKGIEVVFVMLPEQGVGRALEIIDELGDTTASVYFVPNFAMYDILGADLSEVEGVPVLRVAETPMFGVDGLYKHVFDVTAAFVSLLFLSPALFLIALAVRLESPGPVIYRQKRYGLNGQEFVVYKFRTMRISDPEDKIVQVSRNDPRVTKIGSLLRRTSLDELPQLWNVLRGDMSLVGPRPHAVQHNEYYRKAVKRYMLRHKVKPGLTGWAQVNGFRGATAELVNMEERVRYDLDYIRRWSPLLDIKIILSTLVIILRDRNAY